MHKAERLFVYGALAASIAISVSALTGAGSRALAADEAPAGDHPIALCAIMKIADDLMNSDRYKPQREEFGLNLRTEQLDPLLAELREMQNKLGGMDQQSPEFRPAYESFMRKQQEAAAKERELSALIEAKVTEQLRSAYEEVRASAVDIAKDRGYAYLISSGAPDSPLETKSVLALVNDVLARPLVHFPEGVDISDDVRDDLNLE